MVTRILSDEYAYAWNLGHVPLEYLREARLHQVASVIETLERLLHARKRLLFFPFGLITVTLRFFGPREMNPGMPLAGTFSGGEDRTIELVEKATRLRDVDARDAIGRRRASFEIGIVRSVE